MPVPDLNMNAIEGIIFATEAVVCVGGAEEISVESVSPTVIAALDSPGEMSFGDGADTGTTMPADVEKRMHRVTGIPRNDDAFTRNLAQKIVARRRNLVCAPSADPGLAVKAFELIAKQIGVCVVTCRQSCCKRFGVSSWQAAPDSDAIRQQLASNY